MLVPVPITISSPAAAFLPGVLSSGGVTLWMLLLAAVALGALIRRNVMRVPGGHFRAFAAEDQPTFPESKIAALWRGACQDWGWWIRIRAR